jgi:predicted DNA-binding protein
MTTITIPLSDERLIQLRELAAQTGLEPAEYLRRRVESWLEHPDDAFTHAAARVLQKNTELYRRLA